MYHQYFVNWGSKKIKENLIRKPSESVIHNSHIWAQSLSLLSSMYHHMENGLYSSMDMKMNLFHCFWYFANRYSELISKRMVWTIHASKWFCFSFDQFFNTFPHQMATNGMYQNNNECKYENSNTCISHVMQDANQLFFVFSLRLDCCSFVCFEYRSRAQVLTIHW